MTTATMIPAHDWLDDRPRTHCRRCGAARHLSGSLLPCKQPEHEPPLTDDEIRFLRLILHAVRETGGVPTREQLVRRGSREGEGDARHDD